MIASSLNLDSFNNELNFFPLSSFPITLQRIGLAPNDFVPVPNLIGLFYNEALDKIKDSNLEKGSIKFVDYDKSVPNIVLNQNPKEGTKISQNSKINLVISK